MLWAEVCGVIATRRGRENPRTMSGATDFEPMALQVDKITTIVKAAKTAGVRVVINARTDVFLPRRRPDARLGVAIERGKGLSRRRRRLRVRSRRARSGPQSPSA